MLNSNFKYKNAWFLGSMGGIGSSFLPIVCDFSDKISACDIKEGKSTGEVDYTQANCTKMDEIIKFAEESVRKNSRPELLIITAGYVSSTELEVTSEQEIDKIYT